ncbi:MAG: hypothetical protein IJZ47_02460 [Oscillospiraceae bacterium]|nr:hypothetical protein [Oscillospiraceae bacterium]
MDNLTIVRRCQKLMYELDKAEIEKAGLNEQLETLRKEANDKIETPGCLVIVVSLIVIILLKANGNGWIMSIFSGLIAGGIIDLPFELYRKNKYTKQYQSKENEIQSKQYLVNNRIADIQNDEDYIVVSSIVNDDMNKECLSYMAQLLTKFSNMSLEDAYYRYLRNKS